MLDRSPVPTRTGTVMAWVRERVSGRALGPGARLPSVRRLAEALAVSKSTVVEAYERLAAEGLVTARPGSGFYVAGGSRPPTLAEAGPHRDRAVDPLWVMRQTFEADGAALRPGCGWLPESWMPSEAIRRGLRAAARLEDAALVEYATPLGFAPLRALLARRLAEHGLEVPPGQILLTGSATQAMDLLCRHLLRPGDAVLVDDPCYFNFLNLARAHRAEVVGVPMTPNGPSLDAFAAACAHARPRLYVTNAALHNPTGASLAPTTAHRLLKLVEAHDLTVIEDDILADFEPEPVQPRLAAFDGLSRVIQVGSFSKTLSASVRCGFVAARPDRIEALCDLQLATAMAGCNLSARLTHGLLTDGSYRRHVEGIRTRLARAMGETARRLAEVGLRPWTEPRGGLFLWAELPDGFDSAEIARRAVAEGVVLAPGNVFSVGQGAGRYLRFNVAQSAHPRVFEVLGRAMRA